MTHPLPLKLLYIRDIYPFSLAATGSEVEKFVKLLNHAPAKPDGYCSISIYNNDYEFLQCLRVVILQLLPFPFYFTQ